MLTCRDGSGRCEQLAKKVQEKLDEFKAGKRDLGQVAYYHGCKLGRTFYPSPGIKAVIRADYSRKVGLFYNIFCRTHGHQ